jgi:hypothetical protein
MQGRRREGRGPGVTNTDNTAVNREALPMAETMLDLWDRAERWHPSLGAISPMPRFLEALRQAGPVYRRRGPAWNVAYARPDRGWDSPWLYAALTLGAVAAAARRDTGREARDAATVMVPEVGQGGAAAGAVPAESWRDRPAML